MKKIIILFCILLCTLKSIAYAESLKVVHIDIYVNQNSIPPGNMNMKVLGTAYVSYLYNQRIYLSIDDMKKVFNREITEKDNTIGFENTKEKRLYSYYDLSNTWGGFKDEDGNVIIEPNYRVGSYVLNEGFGSVYGFKSIQTQEDFEGTFMIDKYGELHSYLANTRMGVFENGKAPVIWDKYFPALAQLVFVDGEPVFMTKWGYINSDGNIDFNIQPEEFPDIAPDKKVQEVKKVVCIDDIPIKITNPILSIDNKIYLPLRDIADGFGWEIDWKKEYMKHIVNLYSYPKKEQSLAALSDHSIYIDKVICGRKRTTQFYSTYGYVDENNNEIVSPYTYDDAYDFSENMALVANYIYEKVYDEHHISYYKEESDIEYYFIDLYGNPLFDKTFAFAKSFSEGFAAVAVEGSIYPKPTDNIRWSFIDNKGNYVTDMKFEDVRSFKNGYAKVKQNGKWGVIDTDFNVVVDFKYDRLVQLVEDVDFID